MVSKLLILTGKILYNLRRINRRLISTYQLNLISKKGRNCYINGPGYFTYQNIELGDNVYIGTDSTFMCSESKIIIGSKTVFGPHCFVIGGNHRFDVVGKYIVDVRDKRREDDADIVIGEDCWIGANAIILKGAKIGRGCVIGAGAIVTKSIPPYTIFTNKGSRPRFTSDQVDEHEKVLYKD